MSNTENVINKGSIVRYKTGWGMVTRVTKKTVNITGVWGTGKINKGIPKEEVKEDSAGFYEYWQTTDHYKCM